jgi:hypothetical protein
MTLWRARTSVGSRIAIFRSKTLAKIAHLPYVSQRAHASRKLLKVGA